MSLIYDPSMKIHKAHHEERGPDARRYSGQNPIPFMFFKVDAETNRGLPGACFELCMEEQLIARGISDANGAVYFPSLYPGTYTLAEVSAPDGYENKECTYQVIVDMQGGICVNGTPMRVFRVENSKAPQVSGEFTVIKYDVCTGQRLPGAQLELFISSQPAARGMTDKDGQLVFSGLRPGLYTLVETQPPAGYTRSADTYAIEVRKDGKVIIDGYPRSSVLIENEPIVHFLCFKAIDAQTQQPLAGAVFALLSDGVAALEATSDRFGRVLFENLPAGSYAIRGQTPPAGYSPDTKTYTAQVRRDGTIVIDGHPSERFAVSYHRQSCFRIERINENKAPLPGAVYELRQNGKTVQKAVTGPDGGAAVTLPAPGSYTVTETQPPVGYTADSTPHTVELRADGTILADGRQADTLVLANSRQNVTFSFRIADAQTNAPIAGSLFYLYRGVHAVGGAVSDSTGIVSFAGLCPGEYILREQTAPCEYEPLLKAVTVVIEENGSITADGVPAGEFALMRARAIGIQVNKVNADDEPLMGAVFELRNGSAVLQSAVSGADGKAVFSKPAAGSYTLVETKAPQGYRAGAAAHTVTVGQDGAVTIDSEQVPVLTVQNLPLLYEISFINKAAKTGALLKGAEFELLSGASVITSAIAGADGKVNFGGFPLGAYTIRQASQADGCRLQDDRIPVTVSADGDIQIDGKPAQEFVFESMQDDEST